MDAPRSHTRRTATSWALIGIGAAGIVGAGALTCAEAVSAPAPTVAALAVHIAELEQAIETMLEAGR